MTKASDNEYPSVLFDEQAGDPSTPASGFWRLYFKSGGLFAIDDAAAVTGPFAAAAGAAGAPVFIEPLHGLNHTGYTTVGSANNALFVPCYIPAACTVTGIRYRCGTSSGNLDVGLYDRSGNRLASSGSTATPGTGLRTISFTGSYAATAGGYYLAIASSNNTITFSANGSTTDIAPGQVFAAGSSFPLPSTISTSGEAGVRAPNIIGVVSGGWP